MFKEIKNPEVKDKILSEAGKLFIRNGYNGTSIRDIATASGTNVAMINYYFRSKYNLFEIIFEEALDVLTQKIFSTVSSDLPFFDMIASWVNSYYDTLLKYPQIPIFILNEISMNPERLTLRFKRIKPNNILLEVSKRVHDEVAKGNIRETPPIDFALNVLSLCVFPFIFKNLAISMAENPVEKYDELLIQHKDYVIDFIINALKK